MVIATRPQTRNAFCHPAQDPAPNLTQNLIKIPGKKLANQRAGQPIRHQVWKPVRNQAQETATWQP